MKGLGVVRPSLASLLLALLSAPLAAQCGAAGADSRAITGRVVDGANGSGIAAAVLQITGTSCSALSDSIGSFTLTAPPGPLEVVATFIGYGQVRDSVDTAADVELLIRMERRPVVAPDRRTAQEDRDRRASRTVEDYFEVASMPELPRDTTERLTSDRLDGEFSIRIDRAVADEDLPYLLRAEGLMPNPELIERDVVEWVDSRGGPGTRRVVERAAARPGLRWWWFDFDSVFIPWALSGLAVRDLSETVRSLAASPPTFFGDGTVVGFTYEAEVERLEGGGRIVTLTAGWTTRCGMLCGLIFQHERIVTFGAEGQILTIEGDGVPRYIVS